MWRGREVEAGARGRKALPLHHSQKLRSLLLLSSHLLFQPLSPFSFFLLFFDQLSFPAPFLLFIFLRLQATCHPLLFFITLSTRVLPGGTSTDLRCFSPRCLAPPSLSLSKVLGSFPWLCLSQGAWVLSWRSLLQVLGLVLFLAV